MQKKEDKLFCVGQNVLRKDGLTKAVGAAKYVDDYNYGGQLYAVTVRSPRPYIKINSINYEEAKKVEGFVTLVTHKDVPGSKLWHLVIADQPFLAEDTAKFAGEAIALVVAETFEAAKNAARLVTIDYTELPFSETILDSMKPGAPKIYKDNNIFASYTIERGDADKAFNEADVVVEKTFTTNYQVHVYLETQGMIAVPQDDGGVIVEGSMQCPFYALDAVAEALGITHNKVRILQRTTGGGFGGKEEVPSIVAVHAALCANKTKRPVKIIYDRVEDFQSMSKRHPSIVKIAYAANKEGKLTGVNVEYLTDAGAYSTMSTVVLWRGTVHPAGPYNIENVKIKTHTVATNKVPCGAYRGFGQPQVAFANESLIDELAEKLGIDPIDFRKMNMLKPGDTTVTGQKISASCGLEDVLTAVRKKSDWDNKRKNLDKNGTVKQGIGVSINYYGVGLGAGGRLMDRAGAMVIAHKDGSVIVAVGNVEMGQGANTVLAQIAAETLNAPYDDVKVGEVDTQKVPDSGPTVASRTTLMAGNATIDACMPIRERIFKVAKEMLVAMGAPKDEDMIAFKGMFSCGDKTVAYKDVVKECWTRRLKMSEQGWYVAERTTFDPVNGQGDAYVVYGFSANVAEIELDSLTGVVKVKKITAAHDLGKAINPDQVIGQVHGGALQGVGYALYENLQHKNGIMMNPNMADYIVPSTMEMPEFEVTIVESPYKEGPYHAKGFGEMPLIGPAPAIANAIKDAAGVRLLSLPMIPEKLWQAMQEKN